MKLRKLLALVAVATIVIIAGIAYINASQSASVEAVSKELTIPASNIVDKQTVINALTERLQIVGLEGAIEKEFRYTDTKWFGDKTLALTLHGTFKTGFNIEAITADNIVITQDNEIIINTPDIELIALELPYDRIVIDKEVDLLRKDFTEVDRQLLYAKASASIRKEIMTDAIVRKESVSASQQAIKAILTLVPGVAEVTFN